MIEIKYTGKIPRINQRYFKNFALRPEYREAKEALSWTAKQAMNGKPPIKGDVYVSIDLNNKTVKGDIDSSLKGLLDSLNGIVWVDDKQVKRLLIGYEPTDHTVEILVDEYVHS